MDLEELLITCAILCDCVRNPMPMLLVKGAGRVREKVRNGDSTFRWRKYGERWDVFAIAKEKRHEDNEVNGSWVARCHTFADLEWPRWYIIQTQGILHLRIVQTPGLLSAAFHGVDYMTREQMPASLNVNLCNGQFSFVGCSVAFERKLKWRGYRLPCVRGRQMNSSK